MARPAELLVRHLYDLLLVARPNKDDLSARTNAAALKAITGPAITDRLNPIRTVGNTAVHKDESITRRTR